MDDFFASAVFYFTFLRVDSDYKVIKGEKYELVSLDGSHRTGVFTWEKEDGDYNILTCDYDSNGEPIILNMNNEQITGLVPKVLRDKFDSISTLEDVRELENLYQGFSVDYEEASEGRTFVSIKFDMPIRLEQVTAVPGKQKNDIVVISKPWVSFTFKDGEVVRKSFDLHAYVTHTVLYNTDFPVINSLSDIVNYQNIDSASACINTDNQGRIIIDDRYSCTKQVPVGTGGYKLVPYFVAQDGEVEFEIENTVNGLAKYNASKDKDLKYKINIKNIGDAASSENVIITYIPKEITVKENSISDGGIYDKNENTITWEIDRIEIGEAKEFSYVAMAPDNVNGKELIGKSSINSTQVLGVTFSNNTIVTLDKIVEVIKNPETGTMVYIANTNIGLPLSYLIVSIVLISFILIIFIKKLKNTNEN